MMGVDEVVGPHSSGDVVFSGLWAVYQHVVIIEPFEPQSARNWFSKAVRGNEGGAMKSHGIRTKSSWMRLAKCRKRVHVPTPLSTVSSYVCISMLRFEAETSE